MREAFRHAQDRAGPVRMIDHPIEGEIGSGTYDRLPSRIAPELMGRQAQSWFTPNNSDLFLPQLRISASPQGSVRGSKPLCGDAAHALALWGTPAAHTALSGPSPRGLTPLCGVTEPAIRGSRSNFCYGICNAQIADARAGCCERQLPPPCAGNSGTKYSAQS